MRRTLRTLLLAAACTPTVPTDTDTDIETEAPTSFEVTGVVQDPDGNPVAEAFVMLGGQPNSAVQTDESGRFTIWYEPPERGDPGIVSYKLGHRAQGVEFFGPNEPVTLRLRPIGPDNIDYVYEDPGDGVEVMKEDCSHCHASTVRDFLSSGHAKATRNPLLHDLYAGVNRRLDDRVTCEAQGGTWGRGVQPGSERAPADKCYLGLGVLPELNVVCGGSGQPRCDDPERAEGALPTAFGACADCHAPGIDGQAGGRDLHDAQGLAYDKGVHCDTCHKVRDVDLSQPPGVGQRLIMGRPPEPGRNTFVWDPVYYGPIPDVPVPNMGGSIQPKFDQAVFCAGCHEQDQPALLPGQTVDADKWPNGLPVHSTYSEWKAGPYGDAGTPCQHCHMPGNTDLVNMLDSTTQDNQSILFGWERPPEDKRRHLFRGPLAGDQRLIDTALYASVSLEASEGRLEASVSVANVGCGHAVPTGEPMRSVILLVDADGDCGALEPVGGHTVPDTGGALAMGTFGVDMLAVEGGLRWPFVDAVPGQVLRVVRPTATFDDYTGVGVFAKGSQPASDKGMEHLTPVGAFPIVEVRDGVLLFESGDALETGDIVYLGDPWDGAEDGAAARAVAGRSGTTFSRVLLDADGRRQVPHYRAVDMASDNRIPPGKNALTTHTFALPLECADVEVRATLLYRPVPLAMARDWGWTSTDYVIAEGSARWSE